MLVYAEVNYIFWAISLHTDIHWSVVQWVLLIRATCSQHRSLWLMQMSLF